jgi:hypothetical protein
MRLFRRRGGRHAASVPQRAAPPAGTESSAGTDPVTGTDPVAGTDPGVAGHARQHGTVRLSFSDGSAVSFAHDDPRARAFRAIARELGRRD